MARHHNQRHSYLFAPQRESQRIVEREEVAKMTLPASPALGATPVKAAVCSHQPTVHLPGIASECVVKKVGFNHRSNNVQFS